MIFKIIILLNCSVLYNYAPRDYKNGKLLIRYLTVVTKYY